MKSFILDTSVAVAWYLPEDFSIEARKWQQDFLSGQIHLLVPSLHFLEMGNVLRTYVRRGEIEKGLAEDIYSLHLSAPLKLVEPDRSSLLSTALIYESTVYDAAYIALSESYQAPVLTAERTTTPWVLKLGGLVHTVSHQS